MKIETSDRGYQFLVHPSYTNKDISPRIVSESSAVGPYEDSLSKPGSSYLWFGEHHHLNREEVGKVIEHLRNWFHTGRLE